MRNLTSLCHDSSAAGNFICFTVKRLDQDGGFMYLPFRCKSDCYFTSDPWLFFFFFLIDPPPPEFSPFPLHDALPISRLGAQAELPPAQPKIRQALDGGPKATVLLERVPKQGGIDSIVLLPPAGKPVDSFGPPIG